jgi:hypothetical protein
MTFGHLEPAYRDDEASTRFAGRRYDSRAPNQRTYRFAVCGRCLESDATPFLRSHWLLGWLALCPEHATILITRCPHCRAGLRVAPFATAAPFSPTFCIRCSESLLGRNESAAHPAVIQMQESLLQAKREGVTELEGLGRFTWKEIVALADVLLGTIWTGLTFEELHQIFRHYEFEPADEPRQEMRFYDCRHDSLRFLAWLIDGFPESASAAIAIDMLRRGLSKKRNRLSHHLMPRWPGHPWSPGPHDIDPEILHRLRKLIGARYA